MRSVPIGRTLAFIFVCLGTFSCSFRHPVSQIKAQPRVSTGDGAAAAVRMNSGGESGLRSAAATPAPGVEAQQESSGPMVGHAVLFGYSPEARSLPPAVSSGEGGEVNELNEEIERHIVAGSSVQNEDATIQPEAGRGRVHALSTAALPSSTSFEGLADTDNGAGYGNSQLRMFDVQVRQKSVFANFQRDLTPETGLIGFTSDQYLKAIAVGQDLGHIKGKSLADVFRQQLSIETHLAASGAAVAG